MYHRLALNSCLSYLHLQNAGIEGICQHSGSSCRLFPSTITRLRSCNAYWMSAWCLSLPIAKWFLWSTNLRILHVLFQLNTWFWISQITMHSLMDNLHVFDTKCSVVVLFSWRFLLALSESDHQGFTVNVVGTKITGTLQKSPLTILIVCLCWKS